MRLLHRLRQHVAHRHLVPLGVELDALVAEHRDDAADRVFPDLALGFHVAVEAAEFGDRGGFAGAELDAAVGHQVEAGDAFGHALRRVGGELHDAVAEPDVLRPLAGRAEEHLRRRGMGILLQEMVLDLPRVVVAKPVRQFDLRQRILIQRLLVARLPRAAEAAARRRCRISWSFPRATGE